MNSVEPEINDGSDNLYPDIPMYKIDPTAPSLSVAGSSAPQIADVDWAGGKYHGQIVDGKPHGSGMLTYGDRTYIGEFSNGLMHGQGRMNIGPDQCVGTWHESLLHGKVVWRCPPNVFYCEYEFGMQIGTCKISVGGKKTINRKWDNGVMADELVLEIMYDGEIATFKGKWKDGRPHGAGVLKVKVGKKTKTKIVGEFFDGKPHGECTMSSNDGTESYIGGYNNGKYHGTAVLVISQTTYTGEFANGFLSPQDGEAKIQYGDVRTYVGYTKDNVPHGMGKKTWKQSGVSFSGLFDSGEPKSGKYTDPGGYTITCDWVDGKSVSPVVVKMRGSTYTGTYYTPCEITGELTLRNFNGDGELVAEDGTMLRGVFRNGKLNGQGSYECKEYKFESSFKDNVLYGKIVASGDGWEFDSVDITRKPNSECGIGIRLMVLDTAHIWYLATIRKVRSNEVLIHYDGWGKEYDEWITRDSDRLCEKFDYSDTISSSSNGETRVRGKSGALKNGKKDMVYGTKTFGWGTQEGTFSSKFEFKDGTETRGNVVSKGKFRNDKFHSGSITDGETTFDGNYVDRVGKTTYKDGTTVVFEKDEIRINYVNGARYLVEKGNRLLLMDGVQRFVSEGNGVSFVDDIGVHCLISKDGLGVLFMEDGTLMCVDVVENILGPTILQDYKTKFAITKRMFIADDINISHFSKFYKQ